MPRIIHTYDKQIQDMLVGRKIVSVRYMSQKEKEMMCWGHKAIVLQLDDGNLLYPSSDDEGNNAGALRTNNKKVPLIPVRR